MNKKKFLQGILKKADKLLWQRVIRWSNNTRYLYRTPYIHIHSVMAVEGQGLYIQGWVLGPPGRVRSVEISGQGIHGLDISAQLLWQKDDRLSRRFGMLKHRLNPRFIGLIKSPQLRDDPVGNVTLSFRLNNGRTRRRPGVAHRRDYAGVPAGFGHWTGSSDCERCWT